jgi:hypothetical protein
MTNPKVVTMPGVLDRVKFAESGGIRKGQSVFLSPAFRANYNLMNVRMTPQDQVTQIRKFLDEQHTPDPKRFEWKVIDVRKNIFQNTVHYNSIVEYSGARRPEFKGVQILVPIDFINK